MDRWTVAALVFLTVGLCEWGAGRTFWSHDDHQCVVDMSTTNIPNSQCLIDPWTLGHINHGLMFYIAITLLWSSPKTSGTVVLVAVLIEAAWEIVENQEMVVKRFRMRGYVGDSIMNSFSDLVACWLGVQLACRLGIWRCVAAAIAIELLSLWLWNDNVLRNVARLWFPDAPPALS